MTDEEYNSRIALIEVLVERFPSAEVSANNVKGYVWSLSDLSLQVLQIAIERTIDTHKFSTLPTVAEIRENASEVTVNSSATSHPSNCRCFGLQMYVPDGRDEEGYKFGARRCEEIAITQRHDPIDDW